jgi:hypothetical protein
VRRYALALLVALLTFSTAGLTVLTADEPCSISGGDVDERDCPSTCVTCGCCAQAAEPAAIVDAGSFDAPVADLAPPVYRLLKSVPQDVLHVPRLRTILHVQ